MNVGPALSSLVVKKQLTVTEQKQRLQGHVSFSDGGDMTSFVVSITPNPEFYSLNPKE